MVEITVGIDIGTTSVKAVAADAEGRIVARARVPHELRIPQPDQLEHDAAAAWVTGPRRALEELRVARPAGLCVAAMVPSFAAVGPDGVPVTPGLLYGDARGRVGPPGSHPGASGEGKAFLTWAAGQAPDAAGYWPAQAVANHALAGVAAMDAATAGSVYPLYTGEDWDAAQLAEAGARPDQLPRVAGIGETVADLGGASLASGLVDAIGEQLVSGATDEGDVLVVLGATLLVWTVVGEWREVPGLWSLPHSIPDRFLVGGASNAGGLFLDWVRRFTGDASGTPQPERVPVWEPYPRGERTPLHDPDRRAVLHDLDLTHGPAEFVRAAYEASGFVVRHHLDRSGVQPRRIVASGGGTRVRPWIQAIADASGLPVDVVEVPEGGALGAAYVARVAAGLETDVSGATRWARVGERVEPDPVWAEAMEPRYGRFLAFSGG